MHRDSLPTLSSTHNTSRTMYRNTVQPKWSHNEFRNWIFVLLFLTSNNPQKSFYRAPVRGTENRRGAFFLFCRPPDESFESFEIWWKSSVVAAVLCWWWYCTCTNTRVQGVPWMSLSFSWYARRFFFPLHTITYYYTIRYILHELCVVNVRGTTGV